MEGMEEKKPTPHQRHEEAQISTAEGQMYSLSTFGEKCENGNPHAPKGAISSGSGGADGKKHSKPLDGGDCDLVCRMIKREKESTKPELDSELLDFLKIRGN